MLILLIFSFFFLWLIYREWRNPREFDNFTKGYIGILAVLAVLSSLPIISHLRFESFLSSSASQLADNRRANVKCATVFQSVYDKFGLAGTGNPHTGEIVLQYPTCQNLRDYLDDPENADPKEFWNLHVFTHEAMHVRGEMNEQKTDCQAIQRNIRSAIMLGVREHIAQEHALAYYQNAYQRHPYFSKECAVGKALDESLDNSIW